MSQKRLVIASFISVILVCVLLMGKTYSIYTTTSPDEEINSFKTGTLDIEVIGDNQQIKDIMPTSEENSNTLTPYRIKVKNKGTVPYKFNIKLEETTSSNKIDSKYIMTKVGVLETKPLSDCEDNILKKDIIVLPETTIDIDIRIWISNKVPNTEIKHDMSNQRWRIFAKIKIKGESSPNKNVATDNSTLINPQNDSIQQKDSQDSHQQSDNTKTESLQ